MPSDILIVDARRTAMASPFKGLKEFSAAELAAGVVKDLLGRHSFLKAHIDEVVFGNAVAAGTGQNLARQVVALAGLPITTPGHVVNAVCGSGLQAVIAAQRAILSGEAQAVIAGGVESATQAPYLLPAGGNALALEAAVESGLFDGLRCAISKKTMGELCEGLAKAKKISRVEQDAFAAMSHQKACTALAAGLFKDETVVMPTAAGVFSQDERPRTNMDLRRLAALPAAFAADGTITAGNSSSPADAACALVITSADFVKKHKIKALARICGYTSVALDPQETFTGAVLAAQAVMKKCGLRVKDIDLFEITESFAAQAIYTQNEIKIPSEKMNVFGGDVALGHPLGAAGARALVTLVHCLRQTKKKRGLTAVCFGGGGAIAMVVEKIS